MTPPNKLLVVSDSNELTLVETTKANASKKTELMFVYRYTLSKSKYNTTLSLSEKQLTDVIRKDHMREIK